MRHPAFSGSCVPSWNSHLPVGENWRTNPSKHAYQQRYK